MMSKEFNNLEISYLLMGFKQAEFNKIIVEHHSKLSIPFEVREFQNAVTSGILSVINQEVKDNIQYTYAQLKHVNTFQESLRDNSSLIKQVESLRLKTEFDTSLIMIKMTTKSIYDFLETRVVNSMLFSGPLLFFH